MRPEDLDDAGRVVDRLLDDAGRVVDRLLAEVGRGNLDAPPKLLRLLEATRIALAERSSGPDPQRPGDGSGVT